jgi:peptide/nickel transport system substrate-binding protein
MDAGTGPYKFVAWSPSEYIRLERFDQYWQGPAKIKNVIIQLVSAIGTREMLLFSGEADIAYIDRQYTPDVRGKSYLRIVEQNPTFNVDFIGLNRNISTEDSSVDNGNIPRTFFSDKNVRLAFANAFDYNRYLHDTLLDTAIEGNGAIPAGMVFYNASIPKYSTDLVKAKNYLENATHGSSNWLADGFRLVIYYNDGNVVRRDGAQMFAENLMSLNPDKITVEVQAMEWSQYVSASDAGQLGCYFLGWAPDYADPQDYVQPFCHSHGLYGNTNHLPDTLDAAIEAAAIELNETTRGQMYSDISMQMYNDVYYLWVTQATNFHVERSWISGWYFNPMYSGQYFYALSKG